MTAGDLFVVAAFAGSLAWLVWFGSIVFRPPRRYVPPSVETKLARIEAEHDEMRDRLHSLEMEVGGAEAGRPDLWLWQRIENLELYEDDLDDISARIKPLEADLARRRDGGARRSIEALTAEVRREVAGLSDRLGELEMWRDAGPVDDIDPDTDADGKPFVGECDGCKFDTGHCWGEDLRLAAELLAAETSVHCGACQRHNFVGVGGPVKPHREDCRVGMFLRRMSEGS